MCTWVCLSSEPILLCPEWGPRLGRGWVWPCLLAMACQGWCWGFGSFVVVAALALRAGVSAEAGALLSWESPAAARPLQRGAAPRQQPLLWAGSCMAWAGLSQGQHLLWAAVRVPPAPEEGALLSLLPLPAAGRWARVRG